MVVGSNPTGCKDALYKQRVLIWVYFLSLFFFHACEGIKSGWEKIKIYFYPFAGTITNALCPIPCTLPFPKGLSFFFQRITYLLTHALSHFFDSFKLFLHKKEFFGSVSFSLGLPLWNTFLSFLCSLYLQFRVTTF